MAGNASLTSLQDKMAVNNSTEIRQDTANRNDIGEAMAGYGSPSRPLTRSKSQEGQGQSKKKSSFQITSVVDRSQGMQNNTEDSDLVDDLDDTCETHTEDVDNDVSSDILDMSKNTDIEPEPSSEENTPSYHEETARDFAGFPPPVNKSVPSNQPIHSTPVVPQPVVPQPIPPTVQPEPVVDMQSRFKVVKIESKGSFQRGRWTCQDFLDPHTEKSAERTDKIENKSVEDVGSGNSSASSSIHYVHGVDDPSKNPLVGVTEGQVVDSQSVYQASTVQNGEYVTQQYPGTATQQLQGGVPGVDQAIVNQNQSYEIPADAPGAYDYTGQALPHQSSSQSHLTSGGTILTNGSAQVVAQPTYQPLAEDPGQSSYSVDQTTGTMEYVPTSLPVPQDKQPVLPQNLQSSLSDYSTNTPATAQPAPAVVSAQVQAQAESGYHDGGYEQFAAGQPAHPAVVNAAAQGSAKTSPSSETLNQGGAPTGAEMLTTAPPADISYTSTVEEAPPNRIDNVAVIESDVESDEVAGGAGNLVNQGSRGPSLSRQGSLSTNFLSPPLLEMVSQAMQPTLAKEDGDERFLLNVFSGASTVAIDNKIEQAMDLVKSHLMFAVREEVEVLKEQIKELLEKNSHLEHENSILKAAATPETISQLANQQQYSQPPPPAPHPAQQPSTTTS